MTQTDRLLRFLHENPGSSSLEITLGLGIVNVTGRISDLRKAGHEVEAIRDSKGVYRYVLVEKPEQLAVGL